MSEATLRLRVLANVVVNTMRRITGAGGPAGQIARRALPTIESPGLRFIERLSGHYATGIMQARRFSERFRAGVMYLAEGARKAQRAVLPVFFSMLGLMFEMQMLLRVIEGPFRRILGALKDFDTTITEAAFGAARFGRELDAELVQKFVDVSIDWRAVTGLFMEAIMRVAVEARPFIDSLKEAGETLIEILSKEEVKTGLKDFFTGIGNAVSDLTDALSENWQTILEIGRGLGDAASLGLRALGTIGGLVSDAVESVAGFAERVGVPGAGTMKRMANVAGELFGKLREVPGGLQGLGYAIVFLMAAFTVLVPVLQAAMLAVNMLTLALSAFSLAVQITTANLVRSAATMTGTAAGSAAAGAASRIAGGAAIGGAGAGAALGAIVALAAAWVGYNILDAYLRGERLDESAAERIRAYEERGVVTRIAPPDQVNINVHVENVEDIGEAAAREWFNKWWEEVGSSWPGGGG